MGITRTELLRDCRMHGTEWSGGKIGARYHWPWYRMRAGDWLIVYGVIAGQAVRQAIGRENKALGRLAFVTETVYGAGGERLVIVTRLSEALELRFNPYSRRRGIKAAQTRDKRRVTVKGNMGVVRVYEPWGQGKKVGDSEV